jgi:protein-tyrosine phosphatase
MAMLDIHCHILPAVDDGPTTLDVALTMARFCVQVGITHIVATPHCHRHLRLLRDDILPAVAGFNVALLREGIPLTVLPGSEVQLTDVGAYRRDYEGGRYCHLGDDPGFTLLEFSWQQEQYPTGAVDQVRWLLDHGTRPIIAHPQRYRYFHRDHERLRALVLAGAWVQITVDSLLGNHGPEPQAAGWDLLRSYPDAVLATDAHSLTRCSGLSVGYEAVRNHLGSISAENLQARGAYILDHLLATQSGEQNR